MSPKGQLETEKERSKEGRQPGRSDGQERSRMVFFLPLLMGSVMGKKRDGAGQQGERQDSAGHGKDIQGQRHHIGRQPAQRISEQPVERKINFSLPAPARKPGYLRE